MSDAYRPREHDHLVEPMYHALDDREGQSPKAAQHAEPRRRDRVRVWLPLVFALVGAAVIWFYTS